MATCDVGNGIALRYDPYSATGTDSNGNTTAWTQNPYQYGQATRDHATGELKYGQRWYSPVTGTWTQQDTLNAPLDPANANRYQYAADNPINVTDSTGRYPGGEDSCAEGNANCINNGDQSRGGSQPDCAFDSNFDVYAFGTFIGLGSPFTGAAIGFVQLFAAPYECGG